MTNGPFKMKGSAFYGRGNQSVSPAKDKESLMKEHNIKRSDTGAYTYQGDVMGKSDLKRLGFVFDEPKKDTPPVTPPPPVTSPEGTDIQYEE